MRYRKSFKRGRGRGRSKRLRKYGVGRGGIIL
jgi:hypothetical protein